MKRIAVLLIMIFTVALFAFADSQQGRTEGNLSDSSFVIQGYYKGSSSSIGGGYNSALKEFTIVDYSNKNLSYQAQDSAGAAVVNVSNSHLGSDGTIFTWTMTGTTKNTVTLKFTFSVFQAEMNEMFYRPTYTLKMVINPTKQNSNNGSTLNNDTFYTGATTPKTVTFPNGPTTTTGTKASQGTEFTGGASVQYSGAVNNNNWKRSGYCTLNISDYEQGIPGSYEYRCWIVTELTWQ